ncbi:hypothetical protein [Streptomyces sp. NPDC088146]|uniref:hypothetical protein n=1 Tax=Streptomyces sp. NPDC088146 TaxID=3365829 RepID=UPI003816EFAE
MRPSRRPALKASEIPPQNLNLREGERQSIACPDCNTWHPLYRKMIKTHHLDREVRGGRAPRCPGSAQLIDMDISVEQWGETMLAADSTATGRRSARQHYKPLAETPVPVSRMAHAPKAPSDRGVQNELNSARQRAREAVVLHRSSCTACQSDRFCGTGRKLEERETRIEAARDEQRTQQARVQKADRDSERAREMEHALRRRHQWAERGGELAEQVNNRCTPRLPGSRSEFSGPQIPLSPHDQGAHDRRQAELGRQYARKTPAA